MKTEFSANTKNRISIYLSKYTREPVTQGMIDEIEHIVLDQFLLDQYSTPQEGVRYSDENDLNNAAKYIQNQIFTSPPDEIKIKPDTDYSDVSCWPSPPRSVGDKKDEV